MQKYIVIALVVIVLAAGGYCYWKFNSKDYLSSFNLPAERIAQDLDGKSASVAYGQIWPFDPTQSTSVKVLAKKQVDEYVVVAVEVSAVAKIEKKDNKDNLPDKLRLGGVAKLTYESIGSDWYLVSVDGVSLRATPVNAQ